AAATSARAGGTLFMASDPNSASPTISRSAPASCSRTSAPASIVARIARAPSAASHSPAASRRSSSEALSRTATALDLALRSEPDMSHGYPLGRDYNHQINVAGYELRAVVPLAARRRRRP